MKSITLLALVALAVAFSPTSGKMYDLYLVPHSHCDVGWLYTYETYFYNGTHGTGSVHNILSTVIENLYNNPDLRFIWAETVWVKMWWDMESDARKAMFKQVVASGQLEFVGGGWSMNDETLPIYNDVIDQVTVGHEYLKEIFNVTVTNGYQIDMFSGYSGATPTLWANAGYSQSLIRWEGPWDMRDTWNTNQWAEFIWQASSSLDPSSSQMFTHIIWTNYGDLMGSGLDWENNAQPPVTPANVAMFAARLSQWVQTNSAVYRGPALALWGTDFKFGNASVQFGNMSQVVAYVNAHPEYNITVQFSTLTQYYDALYAAATDKDNSFTFPVLNATAFEDNYNDFQYGWPHFIGGVYEHNGSPTIEYQTGCPSSIPTYKTLIRSVGTTVRQADVAFALSVLYGKVQETTALAQFQDLLFARRAMGIAQHHDSLAGTMATKWSMPSGGGWSYDDVLTDYVSLLTKAQAGAKAVLQQSVEALAGVGDIAAPSPSLTTILVSNSLAFPRRDSVTVRLTGTLYGIYDQNMQPVVTQVAHGLAFWVANVPALGFATYYVNQSTSGYVEPAPVPFTTKGASFTLQNKYAAVTFSSTTGTMLGVTNLGSGVAMDLREDIATYVNGTGGAYVLVEDYDAVPLLPINYTVLQGPLFQEVCQTFPSDVTLHCVILYTTDGPLDASIEVFVEGGPLSPRRELISRFVTTSQYPTMLYTDDEGLEMHARPQRGDLLVGGNYHACVAACHLVCPSVGQVTVLTRNSMGIASLWDGTIELMLARRMNTSDSQGPWPLNDDTPFAIPWWLLVDTPANIAATRHQLSIMIQFPLSLTVVATPPSTPSYSFGATLPANIHLVSLFVRELDNTTFANPEIVMRLHHMVETGDGPLDTPATVDLARVLVGMAPSVWAEKTLTLQWDKDTHTRRVWPTDAGSTAVAQTHTDPSTNITLTPQQIRTFVLQYGSGKNV